MPAETHYLRITDITDRIPVSRATIYRLMLRNEFPKSIRVGASSLWIEEEVLAWEKERASARFPAGSPLQEKPRSN